MIRLPTVSRLNRCWLAIAAVSLLSPMARGEEPRPDAGALKSRTVDGRELFTREWIPGDKRSHGGDGLGPLFNESSCVACHNQGGVGGGGPASKNAQLLTAFPNPPVQDLNAFRAQRQQSLPEQIFRGLFGSLDEVAVEEPVAVQPDATPAAIEIAAQVADPFAQVGTGRAVKPLSPEKLAEIEKERKNLGKLHPGLATAPSVVLHRAATYGDYEQFRQTLVANQGRGVSFDFQADNSFELFNNTGVGVNTPQTVALGPVDTTVTVTKTVTITKPNVSSDAIRRLQMHRSESQMAAQRRVFNQAAQHGNFAVVQSERNTSALFGTGLIDRITDEQLKLVEAEQLKAGRVSGRISSLKDGKIGRFGWKGQIAHLDDFVLTACAVELGLQVPGHSQAGLPHKPDYVAAGLDLNAEECRELTRFVSDLPAPKQRSFADETEKTFVSMGKTLFEKVGCSECHREKLGDADGIFSDLLLHDMGPDLGDSGSSYGIFVPDSTPEGQSAPQGDLVKGQTNKEAPKLTSATRQEWRTPPLWGVRDSAPYLHDGRAESLEQAIAFHGGEATHSAQRFFDLKSEERFQVVTFLKSLVAPGTEVILSR